MVGAGLGYGSPGGCCGARAAVTKRCLAFRISRVISRSFWTSAHSARHSSVPDLRMTAAFRVSIACWTSASSASASSRAGIASSRSICQAGA